VDRLPEDAKLRSGIIYTFARGTCSEPCFEKLGWEAEQAAWSAKYEYDEEAHRDAEIAAGLI
jgi:hypothetical protein